MIVTNLRISNFRSFEEAELRIAPITIVTGANNAGKTSLFAPLLAAAQTDGMPAMLSPNGRYVAMGDFLDMAHRHREDSHIGLHLRGQAHPKGDITIDSTFAYDAKARSPRLHDLTITGPYYNLSVRHTQDEYDLAYDVTPDALAIVPDAITSPEASKLFEAVHAFLAARLQRKGQVEIQDLAEAEPLSVAASLRDPRQFFDELSQDGTLLGFRMAADLRWEIASLKKGLHHVSSFRLSPERTYYEAPRADLRIGRYGENYVQQISQWDADSAPEGDRLRQDLAQLGVLVGLKTRRLKGGRLELVGKPRPASPLTNLVDLGFGTSQVLPILVAINQASDGDLFTVSQPEIHLHPEVQAQLGDYFVGLAKNRKMRLIIETHSEYLVNRLRLLVAEGAIAEDEVSLVYVVNNGRKATVKPMRLRADGQIEGAPSEFFTTYLVDVMKLAMGS